MIRHYSEAEVDALLQARPVTDALEQCFLDLHHGRARQEPRLRVVSPPYVQHNLAAVSQALGYSSLKSYLSGPGGVSFGTMLFELATCQLVAVLESARLGQLRTGCATALAARHLAPPGELRLALIGTGFIAQGQLEALTAEFGDRLVESRVYSRKSRFSSAFPFRQVDSSQEALQGANLVVTATSSSRPVLSADQLDPAGGLLCCVGGNSAQRSEVGPDVVSRCGRFWADCPTQARVEAGEFLKAPEFAWDALEPLSRLVAEGADGPAAGEWVCFKSLGVGLEDLAAAWLVWRNSHK